jgi:hypothetical protein
MQDETTRLVQEGHLSQGAFASTALHIDGADSDGDESRLGVFDESEDCIAVHAGAESFTMSPAMIRQALADDPCKSWYVGVQPIFQDLGKVAEADKTLRKNLNERILDVWEILMQEYHEFALKNKPDALCPIENEYNVVSCRTAAKGPRLATRL